jgi:exonuclease III
MAILNISRVINRSNNKLTVNGAFLNNNSKCELLKHKLSFMVYHQNIRSIRGKIDELLSMWCNAYPHVLCLSEHHLRNEEISILCCRPYLLAAKYCRNINKSGGVCIYVHESVSFIPINLDSYCKEHEFEVCAVKLCIMSATYCIIAIYRSPTGKVPYFISALDLVLRKLYSRTINLILCGDFNINHLSNNYNRTQTHF